MRYRIMIISIFSISTFILSGCLGAEDWREQYRLEDEFIAKSNIGLPPDNYEQLIKKWGDNNLKDPSSAEYSHISYPKKALYPIRISFYPVTAADIKLKQRVVYSVGACINAKNSYGGYSGKQFYDFSIDYGHIINASALGALPLCNN